ncbi:uncharacterized protein BXZ73DRAFT_77162 [Epithele typhae]|uniref:uncharacterized protein n=1 Tax=Epithele typhae TaxID=378194 RepID=UPI0020082D27|nr:uncharacterized protein BXZ73DRAFT_77162 [Epithele typhae]KAH9934074.1 hypothetical protein BXZ73DRAFT_77162 [Epithele typhae]
MQPPVPPERALQARITGLNHDVHVEKSPHACGDVPTSGSTSAAAWEHTIQTAGCGPSSGILHCVVVPAIPNDTAGGRFQSAPTRKATGAGLKLLDALLWPRSKTKKRRYLPFKAGNPQLHRRLVEMRLCVDGRRPPCRLHRSSVARQIMRERFAGGVGSFCQAQSPHSQHYRDGLNGAEAAWAAKKYASHHGLPPRAIFERADIATPV